METALDDPYLLITDKKISAVADVLPLLERLMQTGKKELVIIAEDVDGEALATLVVNKLRGTRSRAASTRSRSRSMRRSRTMTARSCRSGWQSGLAAWQSSRWARQPRSS